MFINFVPSCDNGAKVNIFTEQAKGLPTDFQKFFKERDGWEFME
jgi:hypothetical protein